MRAVFPNTGATLARLRSPNFAYSLTVKITRKDKVSIMGLTINYELDMALTCAYQCRFKGTQWQCNMPVNESVK